MDKLAPLVLHRWLFFAAALFVFAMRVVAVRGFYVVAYALAIYLLNLCLLFLSPRLLSSGEEDVNAFHESFLEAPPLLPTRTDDEFRPFVRRLPEFDFWHNGCKAILLSLACTLFTAFDIPVFWPVLVVYFLVLFAVTMRRQIAHMVKYKYVPFDMGKKRFGARS